MDFAALDSLCLILDPLRQAGVALALVLVMFSAAPGQRLDDFHFLVEEPLRFLGGFATQVLVLPLYAVVCFIDILIPVLSVIGLVVLIHNAAAFATGAFAGFVLSRRSATRRALTFEIGIQNSGLALAILLSRLKGLGGAAAVAAVWGVWHLIAGSFVVGLFRIWDNGRQ